MSEAPSSSPGEPAGVEKEQPRKKGPSIAVVAHELRNPLGTVANGLELLESEALSGDGQEMVTIMKTQVRQLKNILTEATDQEILPEQTLEDVCTMIVAELEKLRTGDRDLAGTFVVGNTCAPQEQVKETRISESQMHVTIDALPDELRLNKIPCSSTALQQILRNLLSNSLRKGAREIRIRMYLSGYHEVALAVSDDGKGMSLEILQDLRRGRGNTDKTKGDGIGPDESVQQHGHGVTEIQRIITQKCGGKMNIFSVKQMGEGYFDSDEQDEESVGRHPFAHGVTFEFKFTVENVAPNGDHGVPHSIADVRRVSRRYAAGLLFAGGLTALGAVAVVGVVKNRSRHAREEAASESLQSPITDIELDENGRLVSFAFSAYGENAVYKRGKRVPDLLRDVKSVPFAEGSITTIEPAPINDFQLRPMFLYSTPQGIFGDVNVPRERGQLDTYLCAQRGPGAGRVDLSRFSLYPKQDTLFNSRIDPAIARAPRAPALESRRPPYESTSIALLQSRTFGSMQSSLQDAVNLFARQTDGSPFNGARLKLLKALSAHRVLNANGVHAKDPVHLRTLLPAKDKFILAEEPVVRALRRDPLSLEEAATARKNNVIIGLPSVSPTEAQAMIRTEEA